MKIEEAKLFPRTSRLTSISKQSLVPKPDILGQIRKWKLDSQTNKANLVSGEHDNDIVGYTGEEIQQISALGMKARKLTITI